jgi:hypothetical protein
VNKIKVSGGCHCGLVGFEICIAETVVVQHCNCSMCSMVGFIHLIVPAADFQLLKGSEFLVEYRFNSGTAKHLFCARCGVKSFYVPRSNPDGYSVNLRCLQLPSAVRVREEEFDGLNWEQNAASLEHLSKAVGTTGDETG